MSDTIIVYENGKAIGGEGHPTDANEITFNNEDTDLESEEVESAIKEVNAKFDRGSVSVTADGTKTRKQLLNALYALVDSSKLSGGSYISFSARMYRYVQEFNGYYFTCATMGASALTLSEIYLNNTSSKFDEVQAQVGGSTSYTDGSSGVPSAGTVVTLFY